MIKNIQSVQLYASYYFLTANAAMYLRNNMRISMAWINPNAEHVVYRNGHSQTIIEAASSRPLAKKFGELISVIIRSMLYSVYAFVGAFLSLMAYFKLRGKAKSQEEIHSGNILVDEKRLRKILIRQKKASSFHLGELPLVKGTENQHILITGAPGTGKTNCIKQLLEQVRTNRQKAIIVDTTGDYVNNFFRENQDFILNPLDARTQPWSFWGESSNRAYDQRIAAALIGDSQNLSDPFWMETAKSVLSTTIEKLRDSQTPFTSEALHYMLYASLKECEEFYQDTKAASFLTPSSEKTALSIRSQLSTKIECLESLGDTESPFSITKWLADQDNDSWLFITSTTGDRELLRPLISMWLDVAIRGIMLLEPDITRRVWIFIDELPNLQALPSLKVGLAELRKFGGCIVTGVQNLYQLVSIYGHELTRNLLSLFGTTVHFKESEPQIAKWLSDLLGVKRYTQIQESISYGAHDMRDGVSLSQQKLVEPLVKPEQIMRQQTLEAYVRLPEDFPIAQVKFKFKEYPKTASAFVSRNIERTSSRKRKTKEIETLNLTEESVPEDNVFDLYAQLREGINR